MTALIDYLLSGDDSVIDLAAADVNADEKTTISDVTALIDILLSTPSTMLKAWDAMPADGGICVENLSDGEVLEIYDMDGDCRAVVKALGNSKVDLPAGIYVVSGDIRSRKVVVK